MPRRFYISPPLLQNKRTTLPLVQNTPEARSSGLRRASHCLILCYPQATANIFKSHPLAVQGCLPTGGSQKYSAANRSSNAFYVATSFSHRVLPPHHNPLSRRTASHSSYNSVSAVPAPHPRHRQDNSSHVPTSTSDA